MKRVVIAGAVAGALLLSAMGAYAGKQLLDQQAACDSVKARISATGEVVHVSQGARKVAILGDSYVMGDGLEDRTQGWVYRASQESGWDATADGVSSTGYTNGGFCGGQSYPDRVGTAIASKPQTLIIQGGLNDWKADSGRLESEVSRTLMAASSVPVVILVGPVNAPSRAETLPEVDKSLAAVAKVSGAKYISALDWNLEYLPDNLHLTPAGHAQFAAHVAAAVKAIPQP